MKKFIALSALSLIALTGCSQADNNVASAPASSSVSTTQAPQKDVKNWSATDTQGTKFVLTQGVSAPPAVEEARRLMGKSGTPLNYIAVMVDNINGSAPTSVSSASFTTPEGKLVEYTFVSDYLNYQDVSPELDVETSNRIIDVHNVFSGDDYKVAAGEKKTVLLASDQPYPVEITHALVNESTALEPSSEKASAENVSTQGLESLAASTASPSPSETPVQAIPEANKTSFSGTTLKGNDLNFIILPETTQQTMDEIVYGSGATGSWGALCSAAAAPEQLAETGVTTAEPDGGHAHVWRSLKYTADEANDRSKIDGLALANIMNSDPEIQSLGKQCVVMNSQLTSAGANKYPSATAGQYIGGQLSNTVELH